MSDAARQLVFHAAVMLLIGLLCGAPYGRAINRGAATAVVHGWRVAHASLPLGAVVMLGVAAVMTPLAVPLALQWAIACCLIVSGYAFCVSLPLGASLGERGLSNRGPVLARVVYAGNLIGAGTSLLASVAFVYAAWAAL